MHIYIYIYISVKKIYKRHIETAVLAVRMLHVYYTSTSTSLSHPRPGSSIVRVSPEIRKLRVRFSYEFAIKLQ